MHLQSLNENPNSCSEEWTIVAVNLLLYLDGIYLTGVCLPYFSPSPVQNIMNTEYQVQEA